MKTIFRLSFFFLFFLLIISGTLKGSDITEKGNVYNSYLNSSPIVFKENKGQWEQNVKYGSTTFNGNVYFMRDRLSFSHIKPSQKSISEPRDKKFDMLVWNLIFEGSLPSVKISGEIQEMSKTSYIRNHQTISDVKEFHTITYENIYQGINLKYYGIGQNLKYDFILSPTANIADIKMKGEGIKAINLSRNGELHIDLPWGTVTEQKPYSYQLINGKQIEVNIQYKVLNDHTFGFSIVGNYNKSLPIVIDPVTLKWATYVGGFDPAQGGYMLDMTTDKDGSIYGTGYYPSAFPVTPGAYDETFNGGGKDIFVFKLDESGTYLHYATFIGGGDEEKGYGIAVNDNGEAFITGYTQSTSTSFPTTKVENPVMGGKNTFVCKLNSAGNNLLFSIYLGGLKDDIGNGIKLDKNGNIFLVGETASMNFPVSSNAYDKTYNGGEFDGFIMKFNPQGSIIFSTFFGGTQDDRSKALAIMESGEVFVTGVTLSNDFPVTANAYDKSFNGEKDIFVTKFNNNGSSIFYSTFIGGLGGEEGNAIDVNKKGEAFITGYSASIDYPHNSVANMQGIRDAIITRLNADGTDLLYSRFIGGDKRDEGTSIIVNEKNQAFVAGISESTNFPLFNNGEFNAENDKRFQVFALMLHDDGITLRRSILMGGSLDDYITPRLSSSSGKRVVCDLVISFTSHSPDLKTTEGVYQKNKENGGGGPNGQPAVFKVYFGPNPVEVSSDSVLYPCKGDTIELKNKEGTDPDYDYSSVWQIDGSVYFSNQPWMKIPYNSIINRPDSTIIRYLLSDGCQTDTTNYTLYPPDSIAFSILGKDLCEGGSTKLSSKLSKEKSKYENYSYLWSTGDTEESITATEPGKYKLTIFNKCGEAFSDSITLGLKKAPTVVDLGSDKSMCGPLSIILNAENDQDEDVTYNWSTGETTPNIKVTKGGSYTVTKSNSCGRATDNVNIEELTPPKTSLPKTATICQNQTLTLDAGNPGATYVWSTGEFGKTITISEVGIYWVEITNSCGTSRDQIEVVLSVDAPRVDLGQDRVICSSPINVSLDAGNPGATYLWSDGSTSQTISISKGGTYNVKVTNACGSTSDEINIAAPPSLALELGAPQRICSPGTISLNAGAPGGKTTYLWSDGSKTPSITVTASGTYSVNVSNECGTARDQVEIKVDGSAPSPTTLLDALLCKGKTVLLDAGNEGANYLWSNGATSQTISASSAGNYQVNISNACGAVSASAVVKLIPDIKLNLQPEIITCNGKTITLDAGNQNIPGVTYNWSTGAITPQVSVNTTALYSVTVSNQCESQSGSVNVIVNNALPSVNLRQDTTICQEFSLSINAGSGLGNKYFWYPDNQTAQIITVKNGGKYLVKVTNGCGSSSDSVTVTSVPYKKLPEAISRCSSNPVILDAKNEGVNSTYKWSNGESTQKIIVSQSGVYKVMIENVCGNFLDSIRVSIDNTMPVVELGEDQRICDPAIIQLNALNPGATYLWNSGETTQTISVGSTGSFKVLVTNGCGSSIDSINIKKDAAPPKLRLTPKKDLCNPLAIQLDAENEGADFIWEPYGQKNQTILVSKGGIYKVTASNGCGNDEAEVEINEVFDAPIDLGQDNAYCNTPVTISVSRLAYTYKWRNDKGAIIGNSQNYVATETGNYWLEIMDICGVKKDSVFIVIDKDKPSFDLGKDTLLCTPKGLTLDGGVYPMASYIWNTSESTNAIHVTEPKQYILKVTNSCGETSDTINIAENPIHMEVSPDTVICPGAEVQIYSHKETDYIYDWIPSKYLNAANISDPISKPDSSVTYTLKASKGVCYNLDSTRIQVHPSIAPKIYASVYDGYLPLEVHFKNLGAEAKLTKWNFGDSVETQNSSPVHTFNDEREYLIKVKVQSASGCYEEDSVKIKAFSLFIPNLITPNGDGKNDHFDITNLNTNLNLEVYNRWGQLVYSKDNYVDEWDAKDQNDGIYYYSIIDPKYRKEFKGWLQVIRSKAE